MKRLSSWFAKILIAISPSEKSLDIILAAMAVVVILGGAGTIFWFVPVPDRIEVNDLEKYSEIVRNFFLGLAGFGAATFGLWLAWRRTRAAAEQASVAREKEARETQDQRDVLYTQTFAKGVEQLGDENTSIKLGGIYALERIAKISHKDQGAIMEILSATSREMLLYRKFVKDPENLHPDFNLENYPAEIGSAVIDVIGRRNHKNDAPDRKLYLDGILIHRFLIEGYNYSRANFINSYILEAEIQSTEFNNCNFEGSFIHNSNFGHCNLSAASLIRGRFIECVLETTQLEKTKLVGNHIDLCVFLDCEFVDSVMVDANLRRSQFENCNFRGTKFGSSTVFGCAFHACSFDAADFDGVVADLDEHSVLNFYRSRMFDKGPNIPFVAFESCDLSGAISLPDEFLSWCVFTGDCKLPAYVDTERIAKMMEANLTKVRSKWAEYHPDEALPFDGT